MTRLLARAWMALGGAPGDLGTLEVEGADRFGGPFAVDSLAVATAGAALLAARELAQARTGRAPAVALATDHLAAAFTSERHVVRDGASPGALFDPLSAFFPAADGWVRLHGNYPWHRVAALRALGVAGSGPAAVRDAVAARPTAEVEDAVVAAGGCAAAVRSAGSWSATPAGAAVAAQGLLDVLPGAPGLGLPAAASGALPAAGLRVLDLTRVIAGPVAGRWLAALGADVLRLDAPGREELLLQVLDMGAGKRSALLDLRAAPDRATLDRLLASADVVLQAYRPGALAALGYGPDDLRAAHPHLVVVALSAWGEQGPWARRRGFDSLVQAATGIAAELGSSAGPGGLPCQALDHGTGMLAAAAALRGLAARERGEGAQGAHLALARTAHWLLGAPRVPVAPPEPVDPATHRVTLASPFGRVATIAPVGTLDGAPLAWPSGPRPLGGDPAAWAAA